MNKTNTLGKMYDALEMVMKVVFMFLWGISFLFGIPFMVVSLIQLFSKARYKVTGFFNQVYDWSGRYWPDRPLDDD